MSRKLVPLLLALSLANGSCCYTGNPNGGWDLYTLAIRNLSSEPPRGHDWMSINFKIKGWAGKAWRETVKDSPDQHYSADYEKGFKEGFRDYVEFGGCGEPPAVPTLCYRSTFSALRQASKPFRIGTMASATALTLPWKAVCARRSWCRWPVGFRPRRLPRRASSPERSPEALPGCRHPEAIPQPIPEALRQLLGFRPRRVVSCPGCCPEALRELLVPDVVSCFSSPLPGGEGARRTWPGKARPAVQG